YASDGQAPLLVAGYGVPAALPAVTSPGGVDGASVLPEAPDQPLVAAPLTVDDSTVAWLVAAHRPGASAPAEAILRALTGQVALGLRNAALAREKADLA